MPARRARPPRSPGACTFVAWLCSALSMLLRAFIVGRGPWGNMFEFSVAFAFSIIGGYLFLAAALPDPLDRVHPGRRRARDAALRVDACPATSSRSCRRSRTRRC